MIRGHHRFDEHEFEQALGDGEGQGSLACCSPWGHKESDTTERPNNERLKKNAAQTLKGKNRTEGGVKGISVHELLW